MDSEVKKTETAVAKDFTKTWRYKAGLTLIIVGNGILVLGIIMPALGAGAGTVGTMVVGGEIISLGQHRLSRQRRVQSYQEQGPGLCQINLHRFSWPDTALSGNHPVINQPSNLVYKCPLSLAVFLQKHRWRIASDNLGT